MGNSISSICAEDRPDLQLGSKTTSYYYKEGYGEQIKGDPPQLTGQVKQTYDKLKSVPFKYSYQTQEMIKSPFKLKQNGTVYHGQWKDGKPEGSGKIYNDGRFFQGSFKQGKRQGFGRYIIADGSYYQGIFKSNHFEGDHKGSDGKTISTIVGDFNEYGQLHGPGKISDRFGMFQGKFFNGKSTQGKYIYKQSKNYYVGNYLKDMKHGFGTLYNKQNQIIYQGYWQNDKPNGVGTVFENGKAKLRTFWTNGVTRRDPKEYTIQLK